MLLEPIKITLYEPKTHEKKAEYEQPIITFETLFRAAALSEVANAKPKRKRWWMWWEKAPTKAPTNEQAQIDALLRLVVDFFDGQFSVEDLRKGADISDVMSVLQSIMGRSNRIMQANPIQPRGTRPRHKSKTTPAAGTGS